MTAMPATSATSAPAYLPDVREQYETLPYPQRDPEKERTGLGFVFGEQLEYLSHHAFGGRLNLKGFDMLAAGAGTGDATIFMAEQLRESGGRVVHLDLSEASIEVAKARARVRGLDNIEFIHGSLLELPTMGLGTFRLINCTGVLHHLADPVAGLRALCSVLEEDGLLNLMVYARYGRTWVYHMQALLREVNADTASIGEKIDRAKAIIESARGRASMEGLSPLADPEIRRNGDSGIYDLFLHSQDRAYTVDELYDYVESCGLRLGHWVRHGISYQHAFSLERIQDERLRAILAGRPRREQESILEKLCGHISKHQIYASRQPLAPPPSPRDEQMVPFYSLFQPDGYTKLSQQMLQLPEGARIELREHGESVFLEATPVKRLLLLHLDGRRSIGEIWDLCQQQLQARLDVSHQQIVEEWVALYDVLHRLDWLLLRHYACPVFPAPHVLHRRAIEHGRIQPSPA